MKRLFASWKKASPLVKVLTVAAVAALAPALTRESTLIALVSGAFVLRYVWARSRK
jgi:hypothetical protein